MNATQANAQLVAGSLDQLIEAGNVDSWLLRTALRKIRKLEGEDMTEASALLQALLDRLQDCRTLYFAQEQAKKLCAALAHKDTNHV